MTAKKPDQELSLTAEVLIEKLKSLQSDIELKKIQQYFKNEYAENDLFIGVKMGQVFDLAREFI